MLKTHEILLSLIPISYLIWVAYKAIRRVISAQFSDKITFIKGDHKVTISTRESVSTIKKELVKL